jgi:NADH:ubiquinone oxidoreductase subunit 3 (subunit A)
MVIFILIIFIGYAYDWKMGALDWKAVNKDTREG